MAAVYWKSGSSVVQSLAAAATQSFVIGNTLLVGNGTVANSTITLRTAGTTSNLGILITTNTITATSTFVIRKNGATVNETVSIPASTSGYFEDTTHTDSFAAGDTVCYRLTAGGTGTSLNFTSMSCSFAATTNTVQQYFANGTQAFTGTSVLAFFPIAGGIYTTVTEANTQQKMKDSFTMANMYIRVNTNSRTSTTNVNFRKNTANGNLTIPVTAGTTGIFEDTTHTDSVVSGDLVNMEVSLGLGAGTFTIFHAGVTGSSLVNKYHIITAGTPTGPASSATAFVEISGAPNTSPSEANLATKTNISSRVSNMAIFVTNNLVNSSSTINFRKNSVNGNQAITVPATTTGYFEDTTNTDILIPTDVINYSVTAAASGVAPFTFGVLSILMTTNAGHLLACLGCGGKFKMYIKTREKYGK